MKLARYWHVLLATVAAQSQDSQAARPSSIASRDSAQSQQQSAASATRSNTNKILGPGESIVTEPTYVSSLSRFATTTYTTTTDVPVTRPTDIPSTLFCDATHVNMTGPFCLPMNGTQQIRGKQYSVTWNSDFAPNCSDVYVALTYVGNRNAQQVTSVKEQNILGFWNYTVEKDWLSGQDSQYAQLEILAYNCAPGTKAPQAGPIIEFLSKAPVTQEQPTSRDRILGLSIGLPLALFAFIGTVGLVFWWNKGHREIPKFRTRRGYTGRSARAVRLQDMDPSRAVYRDEPDT